jgi:hypothetical protein
VHVFFEQDGFEDWFGDLENDCAIGFHVPGQCKLKRCACRGEGPVVARDVLERVRASLDE